MKKYPAKEPVKSQDLLLPLTTIDEIVALITLCKSVSSKYSHPKGFEIAIKGMQRGLEKYRERLLDGKDTDVKLSTYLTWYMKTAIEFEEGRKNKDTNSWSWE